MLDDVKPVLSEPAILTIVDGKRAVTDIGVERHA